MSRDDTVVELSNPAQAISDPLTELAREGARRMLSVALEAEVEGFLSQYSAHTLANGEKRFVRNGYLPARSVQTGIGDVPIKQPRVRDRTASKDDEIAFTPSIIPPYLRRSKSLEKLLPVLYLSGLSTGNFKTGAMPESCAALDRQHPRDLFDVKYLLEHEGLSRDVIIGFLLALISSDRPIHEVLNPNFLDQKKAMENQFLGMTSQNFTYEDFEETRLKLVQLINKNLREEDKEFLLSIKSLNPKWDIHNFEKFPTVRWKLQNLEKLQKSIAKKHKQQFDSLKKHLETV